jgi:hypothetical protein
MLEADVAAPMLMLLILNAAVSQMLRRGAVVAASWSSPGSIAAVAAAMPRSLEFPASIVAEGAAIVACCELGIWLVPDAALRLLFSKHALFPCSRASLPYPVRWLLLPQPNQPDLLPWRQRCDVKAGALAVERDAAAE